MRIQVPKRFHGDHGAAIDDPVMQTKEMKKVTYWGLGMNVVLTGTKAVLGVLMNSSSVIADVWVSHVSHPQAVHSLSDMISDFVTLGTVSYSRRAPNKKWIYGYGKLETVWLFFPCESRCPASSCPAFSLSRRALSSRTYPFPP